ncbi:MAG TPA: hypothetical protein VGS12_06530 [Caulobacteraceae bacterium]|nr:hypothetical protein [Caulobacteraceae bacterium]
MKALVPILLDSVASEPQGVGGERGTRDPIWMNVPAPVRAERQVVDGVTVVAFTFETRPGRRLGGLERLEEVDGKISRIVNYYFCPETIALAAERLGLRPWSNGYHQDEKTLDRMIAQAELPWARGPR